jgi:hypothetical protein
MQLRRTSTHERLPFHTNPLHPKTRKESHPSPSSNHILPHTLAFFSQSSPKIPLPIQNQKVLTKVVTTALLYASNTPFKLTGSTTVATAAAPTATIASAFPVGALMARFFKSWEEKMDSAMARKMPPPRNWKKTTMPLPMLMSSWGRMARTAISGCRGRSQLVVGEGKMGMRGGRMKREGGRAQAYHR